MADVETRIEDENPSTQGGPPKWLAFAIVMLLFFVVAAIVFTIMALS